MHSCSECQRPPSHGTRSESRPAAVQGGRLPAKLSNAPAAAVRAVCDRRGRLGGLGAALCCLWRRLAAPRGADSGLSQGRSGQGTPVGRGGLGAGGVLIAPRGLSAPCLCTAQAGRPRPKGCSVLALGRKLAVSHSRDWNYTANRALPATADSAMTQDADEIYGKQLNESGDVCAPGAPCSVRPRVQI